MSCLEPLLITVILTDDPSQAIPKELKGHLRSIAPRLPIRGCGPSLRSGAAAGINSAPEEPVQSDGPHPTPSDHDLAGMMSAARCSCSVRLRGPASQAIL
jgi:hypothetical protein